jgi:SAM-dependent methyltransferase
VSPRPRAAGSAGTWSHVVRTGRTTNRRWEQSYGAALAPVLDVGAGDSPWVGELRAQGLLTVALDPQYSLRPPAGSVPRAGLTVAATAEQLPFGDAVFGTVFMGHVLQHVPDPVRALQECLRVTRSEGRVIVHPVWRGGRQLRRAAALPGVRLIPGRRRRPRVRPALALGDVAVHSPDVLVVVTGVLRPAVPVRALGRIAMRAVITLRRSTAVGPGASR